MFGTRAGTVTIAVLATIGLAACGGPRVAQLNPAAVARARASEAATDFVVSPAGQDADPSAGITVTAAHGTLSHVSVSTTGDPVSGAMSADGKSWHSTWALDVDTSYTVTATGKDAAGHTISTSWPVGEMIALAPEVLAMTTARSLSTARIRAISSCW